MGLATAGSLLATCGGDTVKLFDASADEGTDPCVLSYSPTAGSQVNTVKWNHTNLIVASAGDDMKISLWHRKGQSVGVLPTLGADRADDIEESIVSISFSNKGSRYLCSGGSGHIVRIWDLQRKRCIKWLSGHTDTITGVMYNCKDEHLASISMKGDLILHNLASGARAAELSDPHGQVLRVLDYSRVSRHVLATAGDDGSVHLWDTTAKSPKVSWLKQHSAPTTGACISPSSDKLIATVGLDKKLYILDSGTRRPANCIPYEAPFSSLVYNDDGTILAAGTNSGRVVFFDVRAKPQPLTLLRAYNSSEAVTSLCWQRSKAVLVNENCSAEVALLGGTSEESVLMPDPLPSLAASTFPSGTTMPSLRSSLTASTSGVPSTSSVEQTPYKSRPFTGGPLSKLHAPRTTFNLKDDMEVFSPLVDVHPFTPSNSSWWDENGNEAKRDSALADKKFSTTMRKFPYSEDSSDAHPISDWRSISSSRQDDTLSAVGIPSWKSDSSVSSSPDAWAGNTLPDQLTNRQQIASRFGLSALQTASSLSLETSSAGHHSSLSSSFLTKTMPSSTSSDLPGATQSTLPRRPSTYAERMGTSSVFSEGISSAFGSPKSKKTGAETKEELLNNFPSRQDASAASGSGSVLGSNGLVPPQLRAGGPPNDQQQGASSFSLQLVQRTLEETLGSVQESIHQDVRNLHIELLRQFHLQEMEMSSMLSAVLEKQDALMKEVQQLRRENQQLRQHLL